MEHSIYCRCCLAKDVRMVKMDAALPDVYLNLTGLLTCNPVYSIYSVCYICASKLNHYGHFRKKCLKVNTLLLDILQRNNNLLTLEDINNIDRHFHKLESQYTIEHVARTNLYGDNQTETDYNKTLEGEYKIKIEHFEQESDSNLENIPYSSDNNDDICSDDLAVSKYKVRHDKKKQELKKTSKIPKHNKKVHKKNDNNIKKEHKSYNIDFSNSDLDSDLYLSDNDDLRSDDLSSYDNKNKQIYIDKPSELESADYLSDYDDSSSVELLRTYFTDQYTNNQNQKNKDDETNTAEFVEVNEEFPDKESEDDFTFLEDLLLYGTVHTGQKSNDDDMLNVLKRKTISFESPVSDAEYGIKVRKINKKQVNSKASYEDIKSEVSSNDTDSSGIDDFTLVEKYFVKNFNKQKEINDFTKLDKCSKTLKDLIEKNIEVKLINSHDYVKISKPNKNNKRKGTKRSNSLYSDFFTENFTVVDLTPEMAKEEISMRQLSNNYKNSKHKCNLCFKGFLIETTYKNHMRTHTDEMGKFECEFCYVRFTTKPLLLEHVSRCHRKKFRCKLCPQEIANSYQARNHVNLHNGVKYTCDECGKNFNFPHCLSNHKRMVHAHTCVCDLCGSTFPTDKGVLVHKNKQHRQEENKKEGPTCVECKVEFSTEMAWKRHLVLTPKHNISNGCEVCGDTFSSEQELRIHKRTHYGKQIRQSLPRTRPVTCKLCEQRFLSVSEYKKHMLEFHPSEYVENPATVLDKPIMCDQCGRAFPSKAVFTYHQNEHTGVSPFKCPECGVGHPSPTALSLHRQRQHQYRGNRCHLCPKVFRTAAGRGRHIKLHLNIRPHKCPMCGKAFPNACEVRYHIKYSHNKVPWPKKKKKTIDNDSE